MAGIHISTRVDADAFAVFVRDDAGVEISNATVTVTRRRVDGTGEPVTKQGDLYPLTTDLCAYDIKASDGTNEVSDNIFAKSSVTTPAFGEYDKNFRDVALQLAFTSAGVLVIVFLLGAIVWFWGLDPATRAQPAPLS
ncbi:MAG TPA: hypothetical protein VFX21_04985, partial [Acidimicrobiia bacterium]|nr:hypothetical protein [Acidimicrobiia bacterium]